MIRNLKLIPFLLIAIFMFFYTKDIKQLNTEYLFLEAESVSGLLAFKKKFPELETLIIQGEKHKSLQAYYPKLLDYCEESCDVIGFADEKTTIDSTNATSFVVAKRIGGKNIFPTLINYFKKDKNISIAGHEYTNALLDDYSKVIQDQLFPMMFGACFLLIFVLVRKTVLSLVIFFPAIFSSLLSLTSIKLFYGSMNMVTSIVPLMCFVIILSLGQHIYFGVDAKNTVKDVLKYKKRPILLMLSTTFIGFLSLTISSISVIRSFGILTSSLIVLTSLIAIVWFYLSSHLFVEKWNRSSAKMHSLFEKSFSRMLIFILLVLSVTSIIYFPNKIKTVTDATKYFPRKSLLKETIDSVTKSVGGIPILEIGFEKGSDFTYEDLIKIENLEKEISNKTSLKIISNNTLVKEINNKYTGENLLPSNIFSYTALMSKAPLALKETYPLMAKYYHLTVLGDSIDLEKYEVIVKNINSVLSASSYDYELNGLYYNLMISQRKMISTLAKSFFTSLLIIILIAFVYVKKMKVVTSFLIVNIIPVGLSFIFIYFMNMSLNIATVMTYSIALGMVVDSSFHLIHALDNKELTYKDYVTKNVMPILSSSIILCLSFLLFVYEEFIPIREFGLNLFFIIFIGLIFDLFILPTLYLGTNKVREYLND